MNSSWRVRLFAVFAIILMSCGPGGPNNRDSGRDVAGDINSTGECLRLSMLGHSERQLPAHIAASFRVETCSGQPPPTNLEFTFTDDGSDVSAFESAQATVGRPRAFRSYTLLLLDLSGSIVNSGSLEPLKAAAIDFITGTNGVLRCAQDATTRRVAVYAFDGRPDLQEVSPFTNDPAALTAAIRAVSCDGTRFCADSTTNLYGAAVAAAARLDAARAQPDDPSVEFTAGALIAFTDGRDQADRASLQDVQSAMMASDRTYQDRGDVNDLFLTIGLGGEIDPPALQALGRDGFEYAMNASEIGAAFGRVAQRIARLANTFYYTEYCSPRRAHSHEFAVHATGGGLTGVLTIPYDADGFGGGCQISTATGDGGTTMTVCSDTQMMCGCSCIDPQTDAMNCGACGRACSAGRVCVRGTCSCDAGQTNCAGSCVNTFSDNRNCGACGNVCGTGSTCQSGACTCATSGTTYCGGACVDVSTSAAHCGRCNYPCPSGATCARGSCVCGGGATLCGSRCADLASDATNCGSCGHSCASGQVCSAGTCVCTGGSTLCGSRCANLATDTANCGTCAHACTGGQVCSAGSCVCPAGSTYCSGLCVDLQSDATNCGACGLSCGPNSHCSGGGCSCDAGATACGTACLACAPGEARCGVNGPSQCCPSTWAFCDAAGVGTACYPPGNDCSTFRLCGGLPMVCPTGAAAGCVSGTTATCCSGSYPYFCDSTLGACWDIAVDCSTIVRCPDGMVRACRPGTGRVDCATVTCR